MVLVIAAAGVAMHIAVLRAGASAPDGRFFRHYDVGPLMPFPVIMDHEHGWTFLGIFFTFSLVMAALSLVAAGALHRCGTRAPALLLTGLAIIVVAMTTFPVVFSLDPYAYVAFGRLLGVYGQNPYLQHMVTGAPANDPVFRPLVGFLGTSLPDENYGPLWTLIAGGLSRLAPAASLGFDVWLQRVVAGAAIVAAALGLLRLRANDAPATRAAGVARFALHPLALYESAAAGHNDMLMIAPAIWAFALIERTPLLAGVLLGGAVSIKYVAFIAYPFLAFLAWRRGGLWAALRFKLAAIATIVVCFIPLWPGWSNLAPILRLGDTLIMSPQWLVTTWLPFLNERTIAIAFATVFLVVLVLSVWRYGRDLRPVHVFRSLAALLWVSPLLNPWYVQWLLPAASATGRWARYAWWFGLFVLLRYVEDALRFPSTSEDLSARIVLLECLTIVILVLPVIATAEVVQRWFHRRGASEDA